MKICKQTNILYNTHEHPICETELMFNIKNIPKLCAIHIIHGSVNIWHKLQFNNKWLYILSNQHILTINCINRNSIDVTLLDVGIFTLEESCTAFSKSVTLLPSKSFISNNYQSICPAINILNDICCSSQRINSTIRQYNLQKVELKHVNLHNINSLSHRLDTLHTEIVNINSAPHFVRHYWRYQIVIYIICIILFILVVIKFHKLRGNLRHKLKKRVNNEQIALEEKPPQPSLTTPTYITTEAPSKTQVQPPIFHQSVSACAVNDFVKLGANLKSQF
jgi:hypothetical protein